MKLNRHNQHTLMLRAAQLPAAGLHTDDEEEDELPDEGDGKSADAGGEKRTQRRNVMKGDNNGTPVIDKYSKDITQAAAEGRLDPVVGREREIERLAQILSRRKKNNPVLIGEPG
ncbi:MAG: ATP-dependent Clp protease ATP-binding subunit, partial [Muribaculaceae bacterium]|nr:ATP-dependent Clp protease ATP-binding subunit [Muribaculaceae bacterium]